MNYFELFDLPVSLKVDKALVRKKYLELSKQSHPDYFIQSDAAAQAKSLEASAMVNKALKTFNNPDETIKYVLRLKNLMEDDEKYTLEPDFLMQMMEVNEEIADSNFDVNPNKKIRLHQQLAELENEIYAPVSAIIEGYKEGITPDADLLQVKDYYFKKKYLHRLRQQLEVNQ